MVALKPPVPAARSVAARSVAARLVRAMRAALPEVLEFDGIDLGPATEQSLFHLFRQSSAERAKSVDTSLRPAARLLLAGASSLTQWRLPAVRAMVVALVTNPAHLAILRPIQRELHALGGPPMVHISDGMPSAGRAGIPRLSAFLDASWIGALGSRHRMLRTAGPSIRETWTGLLDRETAELAARIAEADLHRQVLAVACLSSVVRRGPRVILTFDELGRRARLMSPVAARSGVPSLDLPHAEAADPYAIRGATYDLFGVFGPRARDVLVQAGVPATKIREVGAARFDMLIGRPARDPISPRRLLFAAQWLGGQMTSEVKRRTIEIALRAASVAAPCEFVVLPHPLERDHIAREVLASETPPGVTARIERSKGLYELLDGAYLLLTGWSNSVFEALLANVPGICITATGVDPPTTFVEEGLALGATTVQEAMRAIGKLAEEPARNDFLTRALAALQAHIGPLDGGSARRSAALIVELAASPQPAQPRC